MKIVVVHSYYSSESPSGENRVVDSQVRALETSGHDVKLVAKRTDEECGVPFYRLRSAAAAAGYGLNSPLPEIENFKPDVVHVHNLFPNWSSRWMSRVTAPIVSTLHNYRSVCASALLWRDGGDCTDCLDGGSINAIRHGCYRGSRLATAPLAWATRDSGEHSSVLNSSAALIALNQSSAVMFRGLRPEKSIELIPNFTEDEHHDVSVGNQISWVYVGRLVAEKGILWLLQNWPRNRKLHFIGSGPLEGEVRAAASNDPDRFEYLGKLGELETRRRIAEAHGIVIPSLWSEGIPTVALEALQSGTPILISDNCSSAHELTADGAGQIFAHAEASDAFADRVERISVDRSFSSSARKLYISRYSRAVWLHKVNQVYSSVVSSDQ